MKTFREFSDNYNKSKFMPNRMAEGHIELLVRLSNQLNNDPGIIVDIERYIEKIEQELNNIGYTLGDFESNDFGDEGEEDFVIFKYSDRDEAIENVFLSIEWDESGIKMTVNEIDPMEFDDLFNAGEIEIDNTPDYRDDDTDMMNQYVSEQTQFEKEVEDASDNKLKALLKKYKDKDDKKYNIVVNEFEQRGLQESNDETEYKDFVKKMMAKKGIKNIEDLSKEKKKEFFNTIDKKWNSEDEPGEDGLTESIQTRISGKSLTINIGKQSVVFDVSASGIGLFISDGEDKVQIDIKKSDADNFMQELMDHFIENK